MNVFCNGYVRIELLSVVFEDFAKRNGDAIEGEVGNDAIDEFVIAVEQVCVATGCNDEWVLACFFSKFFDEFVNHATEAIEDTSLHGFDGVVAYRFGGLINVELGKLSGAVVKGIELELCAWSDGTAMKCTCAINEVDGDGCAGVDDDA